MPDPLTKISLGQLKEIADLLESTAKRLQDAHKSFQKAGIDELWTRWSDEVPRRAIAMATFADNTLAEMPDQLHSKALGIQPEIERRKERSSREVERNRARREARTALKSAAAKFAEDFTPPEFVKQPGKSQSPAASPSPEKKPAAKKAAKKKGA